MTLSGMVLAGLWLVIGVLTIGLLALARQIGILFERISPLGQLAADAGPAVGSPAPVEMAHSLGGDLVAIGGRRRASQLLFFLSPTCPVCKTLIPTLKSVRAAESDWLEIVLAGDGERAPHEWLVASAGLEAFPYVLSTASGVALRVGRLPYAVLIDSAGVIAARQSLETRADLEALLKRRPAEPGPSASAPTVMSPIHAH